MKDFYELMSQVEEKNRQKRMMLAQAAQPFFDALYQKRVYDETYQKKLKEQEDANARYSQSLAEYEKTGVVPATADPALHNLAFSRRTAEQDRKAGIRNELEAMGFGDAMAEIEAKYPNIDPDVLKGMVMEQAGVEAIDKKAKGFGSKYYQVYQDVYAKTGDPYLALGDMTARMQADEEAKAMSGRGGGTPPKTGDGTEGEGKDPSYVNMRDADKLVSVADVKLANIASGKTYGSGEVAKHVIKAGYHPSDRTHSGYSQTMDGKYKYDGTNFYELKSSGYKLWGGKPNAKEQGIREALVLGYSEYRAARKEKEDAVTIQATAYGETNSAGSGKKPDSGWRFLEVKP